MFLEDFVEMINVPMGFFFRNLGNNLGYYNYFVIMSVCCVKTGRIGRDLIQIWKSYTSG